jgi:hypothetical protein
VRGIGCGGISHAYRFLKFYIPVKKNIYKSPRLSWSKWVGSPKEEDLMAFLTNLAQGSTISKWCSRFGFALLAILTISIQVAPLLIHRPFYIDWINHVWAINYFKENLLTQGDFPLLFNSAQGAGNPSPIFYGYLFYPVLSLIALLTGADLSLRLVAFALIVGNFIIYFWFCRKFFEDNIAYCLSAICMSSIYQMTNLYNRSAITEFYAHELLSAALPLLFYAFLNKSKARLTIIYAAMGLITAAAGAHPPTIYLAFVFLIPIILLFMVALLTRSDMKLRFVDLVPFIIAAGIVAPWAYCTIKYSRYFMMTTDISSGKIWYFTDSIDSVVGKLWPFYMDSRTLSYGIMETSTPFLEATLQIPLLVTILILFFVKYRKLKLFDGVATFAMFLMCGVIIFLSIPPNSSILAQLPQSPDAWYVAKGKSAIYDLIIPVQFAYRLSNTFSLLLLSGFLFSAGFFRNSASTYEVFAVSFLSKVGLVVVFSMVSYKTISIVDEFYSFPKYYNSSRVDYESKSPTVPALNVKIFGKTVKSYREDIADVNNYPDLYYGREGYSMPNSITPAVLAGHGEPIVPAVFDAGKGDRTQTLVECVGRCIIQTNILPTLLVRISLNGHEIDRSSLLNVSNRVAFVAEPGSNLVSIEPIGRALLILKIMRWLGVIWLVGSVLYLFSLSVRAGRNWFHATKEKLRQSDSPQTARRRPA